MAVRYHLVCQEDNRLTEPGYSLNKAQESVGDSEEMRRLYFSENNEARQQFCTWKPSVLFYCLLPHLSTIFPPQHNQMALLKILSIMLLPSENNHCLPLARGKIFSGAWAQGPPQYALNSSFEPSFLLIYCKTSSSKVNLSTIFSPLSFACWSAFAFTYLPPLRVYMILPPIIKAFIPCFKTHSKFCVQQNILQIPGELFPLQNYLEYRKYNTKLLAI